MRRGGWYAVARGRVPGIYSRWEDCERQVKYYRNSRYKKFRTLKEAEKFIQQEQSHANDQTNTSAGLIMPFIWLLLSIICILFIIIWVTTVER